MLEQFEDYIREQSLCNEEDSILLAVSGGIDSMVMADLFRKSGYNIGIAHCNFLLRGSESDEDESFVDAYCLQHGLKFFTKRFETEKYARDNGISIQMAARELRYSWFEEIRESGNYQFMSLAHNLDDVIETYFINLSRGTGIRGLTGIKPKKGKIIRPLLFASREDIVHYSTENQVQYREDSSNKTIKYARNRIRHQIIPELSTINPRFRENITDNISNLADVEVIYQRFIEEKKREILSQNENRVLINIVGLKQLDPLRTILYEFLRPYHFPKQTVSDIIESLDGIAGKQFYSPTHRLIKDREELIITEISESERNRYYIEEDVIHIAKPIAASLSETAVPEDLQFSADSNVAYLDRDLLEFPLIIRRWEKGDYFQPLGMNNIKKLSDFFIDNKLSIHDKENTWLLTSGNKIIWIIGHRIDDRFKITGKSTRMLVVEVQ